MQYISTDESEKYDIKNGLLTESPVRGSTTRFICNPVVDDIEADEPNGRVRKWRAGGRVFIDTTAPDSIGYGYKPPKCLVSGEPSVNDLATHRWHNDGLPDAETEAKLIQRIQDGVSSRPPRSNPGRDDERALRQLLEAFHRTVVGPASDYVPRGTFSRRQPKKQKHTDELLYEDLTSVGCFALWQSTLKFDPDRSYRFSTLSRHKTIGAISNEASYLRKGGYTSGDTAGRYSHKKVSERSETRLDRWIFDHLSSPPEDLLEAQKKVVKRPIYHSLQEAADALKRANNLEHPDVYSDSGDDDIERNSYSTAIKTNTATEPLDEFRDIYQSQNPPYWSPQFAAHRDKVSPIVDFWIKEFCDPPRIKAKPQPKPVYPPCTVKPTGCVLHPIDKPYWTQPRDKRPIEKAGKPYDPDRREVRAVKMKNGKTRHLYCQMSAGPCRHIEVTPELNARYVAMIEAISPKQKRKENVRPNREQAAGSASSNVIVLESRRSRPQRFHVCQQCNPPRIGDRSARTGIAG